MEELFNEPKLSLKGEFYRKMLHIFSAVIPLTYYFIDKQVILMILLPLIFLMLMVEILKYRIDFVYNIYVKFFSIMLRNHETERMRVRMNGATWLLVADVITIIVFPKYIAITGMLLLSLSDSFSGIMGRLYGKKKYSKNRSYIGTLTFFIVGLLIAVFTPKYFYSSTEYLIAAAAVFLTTIADSINLPADDNLVIPIVSSALLYVLYILFFPGIFG